MDKEKEIEEIVKHACNREGIAKHCPQRIAEALKNAGYGNIEQAVRKFAEYVRQIIVKQFSDNEIEKLKVSGALLLLNNKIKELCGENNNES